MSVKLTGRRPVRLLGRGGKPKKTFSRNANTSAGKRKKCPTCGQDRPHG